MQDVMHEWNKEQCKVYKTYNSHTWPIFSVFYIRKKLSYITVFLTNNNNNIFSIMSPLLLLLHIERGTEMTAAMSVVNLLNKHTITVRQHYFTFYYYKTYKTCILLAKIDWPLTAECLNLHHKVTFTAHP